MNKVILIGRLVQNPEVREVSDNKVCTFDLAITRKFKNAEGKYDTDFVPVVVWGKIGEVIAERFRKGNKILIVGELRTRTWIDKNNNKRKMFEIVANEFEFVEPKQNSSEKPAIQTGTDDTQTTKTTQQDIEIEGFVATESDDLPF